jgi:hypothetical protein
LRYALNYFKDCEITLSSEHPFLFRHLKFAEVIDAKKYKPVEENYLVFETISDPSRLTWEFFSHCITNCVDFPSLCALRMQLPVKDREVILTPKEPAYESAVWKMLPKMSEVRRNVVVHAGKHWPSKTFPKDWWDAVLAELIAKGLTPILIGADTDDNRGTVDVKTKGCIDLRNQISINDSIWLLQHSDVLITNDSSPLHMAVAGKTWIGFIASCKHPDYITHWRNGQWGWRMQNLGLGGIWDEVNFCPNKETTLTVENVDEKLLRTWLPEPRAVAEWANEKYADAMR